MCVGKLPFVNNLKRLLYDHFENSNCNEARILWPESGWKVLTAYQ